jgi:6-phosphogluconate dehydrogenase
MEIGMIGLGRMGSNMVRRLLRARHQCVDYDIHPETVEALVKEGAVGAASLDDCVHKLSKPRALWMMVPAAAVDPTLKALVPLLEHDDVVIDGGNSYYHDAIPLPRGPGDARSERFTQASGSIRVGTQSDPADGTRARECW